MATITLAYSAPSTSYNAPWNIYFFRITDVTKLPDLVIGQEVTNITYIGGTPNEAGTGVGKILSFAYADGFDLYPANASGRVLAGIFIIDSNGVILEPDDGTGGMRGDITFIDPTLTADEENKECFDKLVWDKQCTFAKDVLEFVNQVSFGYIQQDALDCLKNQKRVLEILNCYDTRDIENETTDYNVLTYDQIKKLLN